MEPTVKARIALNKDTFTPIENDIAEYVLENFESVAEENITTLAERSSTSEASVTRFCRKLGFSGFNKFKVALAQDIYISRNDALIDIEASGNPVISVANSYRKLLDNMYALIDRKELDAFVSMICGSEFIYMICSPKMKLIGMELESRIDAVGIKTKLITEYQAMINSSFQSGKGEMAIFLVENIGLSRYRNLALTFKNHGCAVGLITQFVSRKNHDCTDAVLIIVDKLIVQGLASISNNIMLLLLIDVIMTEIISRDRKYLKRKNLSDSLTMGEMLPDNLYFTP